MQIPRGLGGDGRRVAPPNWGRSYPLSAIRGAEQEVARVDVGAPRDFTVMLGDPTSRFIQGTYPSPLVTIQYGTGGTSGLTQFVPNLIGSVYHVIASNVVVRAYNEPSSLHPPVPTNVRFQAMIGCGRPSTQQHTQQVHVTGAAIYVRLMPWVTRVMITPTEPLVDPPTLPTIHWGNVNDNGLTAWDFLGVPLASFASPVPVPRLEVNGFRFQYTAVFDAIVTQFWDL